MKKIIAFTAIRSEYDLLSSLYKLLNADENIDLNRASVKLNKIGF